MASPKEEYEKRKFNYENAGINITKSINLLSNLRLVLFVVGLTSAIYLYFLKMHYLSISLVVAFLIAFVLLVVKHRKLKYEKKYLATLYDINRNALLRLAGEWKTFSDTGEDFKDENHNFSGDLDLFGKGSLFQFINTAQTFLGRIQLKNDLTVPAQKANEIQTKQAAISELATKVDWRQKFLAESMLAPEKMLDPQSLFVWAKSANDFYRENWLKYLTRLSALTTMSLILLHVVLNLVPLYVVLTMLGAQYLMLLYRGNERAEILNTVYPYNDNLKMYKKMLIVFEKAQFKTAYLKEMQTQVSGNKNHTASMQIENLEKIVDWISNRNGSFFFVFNVLTLWDYHCINALENWKKETDILLENWVKVLAKLESLSSLASIAYEQPDWVVPEIREGKPCFKAESMGHPLLSTRTSNNVNLEKPTQILLITGSNMSGKSTLLRTVGINLVLAYAGAPVCAQRFTCSIMDLYTCMRISDNLSNNISSFYAELLRIKEVVKAAEEKENVFFLLDEIFKGTNSIDRHAGAKVLILKLCNKGALGLVSTHDLELATLEEESKMKIKNYHFQEFYKNKEIYFDYILQPGVSKTRNALHLMRMAGIEVE